MADCMLLRANSPRCHISNSTLCFIRTCRPSASDAADCKYACCIDDVDTTPPKFRENQGGDHLWEKIRGEALRDKNKEPILQNYYDAAVLNHVCLESALANQLAARLGGADLSRESLFYVFFETLIEDDDIRRSIREDLMAVKERDPACVSYVQCLLNFKGFLACQAHRVAHKLWIQDRTALALVIQNRVSEVFAMDIHPGARIGSGVMFDHGTGVVIGETAVVGNNVTILHGVTLGGTGKVAGDRHPKIGDGVLIGAGAKLLGNVRIGENAKIGAASVVLKDIPARATAVGNPARVVGLR